jgi:hypothetical protein
VIGCELYAIESGEGCCAADHRLSCPYYMGDVEDDFESVTLINHAVIQGSAVLDILFVARLEIKLEPQLNQSQVIRRSRVLRSA